MVIVKDKALKMAIEYLTLAEIELAWNLSKPINACKEALEQPTVAELNDEYLRDTYVDGLNKPTWQGLTDGEALEIYCDVQENCIKDFPSELNAAWFKAVKEKNNG